jgi:ribulose-phosphate 3-epimerase
MNQNRPVLVAPSLLAADFSQLENQICLVEQAGADLLHLDIMDGIFVPNISFGIPVIKSIRQKTDLFFDTHLMISNPIRYIEAFKAAGANSLTIHIEACPKPQSLFMKMRQLGLKVGLAINPQTPVDELFPFLEDIDVALVMSVEPGFGGQVFQPDAIQKITKLRSEIEIRQLPVHIQVDGGINLLNSSSCIKAGANQIVAGSAIFGQPNPDQIINKMRK